MHAGRETGPSCVREEADEKRSDPCVESVVCPSSDNVSDCRYGHQNPAVDQGWEGRLDFHSNGYLGADTVYH